ncbi:hypothetical protein [Nonomuraea endophytica]
MVKLVVLHRISDNSHHLKLANIVIFWEPSGPRGDAAMRLYGL